jgi:hypothetical protein
MPFPAVRSATWRIVQTGAVMNAWFSPDAYRAELFERPPKWGWQPVKPRDRVESPERYQPPRPRRIKQVPHKNRLGLPSRGKLVNDPQDEKAASIEYQAAYAAWQQRINQFESAERERHRTVPIWYPVPISSDAHLICAFGGTTVTWAAALLTLGASLLGSGRRVTIADLSRRTTTADLVAGAQNIAHVTKHSLPAAGEDALDLFATYTWQDLSTLLADVIHAAKDDVDVSRLERQEDRAVIRDVASCLDPGRPVSVDTLRKGLLVVGGGRVPIGDDGEITFEEYDRLSGLYSDLQHQYGGVLQRVSRIERTLRDFSVLDPPGREMGEPAVALAADAHTATAEPFLEVIEVNKRLDDLDNERVVDLLFHLLLRRVRTGGVAVNVLVILGADRIQRAALETLATFAEHERMHILLFFEHLRGDAVEVIGAGGAAAAFFGLGNHQEAREASDFIGKEWRWVESSRTRSRSDSFQVTTGESRPTRGFMSSQETTSRTESSSTETGETKQWTREAMVDPEVIQGLPVMGLIYVEVGPEGSRRIFNLDCDPTLAHAPRVARKPLSVEQAVR